MIVESINDVIKLSGDLTTNQWEAIRTAAGLVLKRHPRGVVVDCGGLNSITEIGANTFYDMMMHIEKKKARIIVANVPAAIKKVLQAVPDVRSGLAMTATVEDAQQSLDLLDTVGEKSHKGHISSECLLLVLSGSKSDSPAIGHASAIAEKRQLNVVLLFPILVPQSLPTSTPLPEKEDAATGSLQIATRFLGGKGLSVIPALERTRSVAVAVDKVATEHHARVVVVALPAVDLSQNEPAKTVEGILRKVKGEIVFVREGQKQSGTEPSQK